MGERFFAPSLTLVYLCFGRKIFRPYMRIDAFVFWAKDFSPLHLFPLMIRIFMVAVATGFIIWIFPVQLPFQRVVVNIFPDKIHFIFIAYDMFIIVPLPHFVDSAVLPQPFANTNLKTTNN
jgi:hypothetical protein